MPRKNLTPVLPFSPHLWYDIPVTKTAWAGSTASSVLGRPARREAPGRRSRGPKRTARPGNIANIDSPQHSALCRAAGKARKNHGEGSVRNRPRFFSGPSPLRREDRFGRYKANSGCRAPKGERCLGQSKSLRQALLRRRYERHGPGPVRLSADWHHYLHPGLPAGRAPAGGDRQLRQGDGGPRHGRGHRLRPESPAPGAVFPGGSGQRL